MSRAGREKAGKAGQQANHNWGTSSLLTADVIENKWINGGNSVCGGNKGVREDSLELTVDSLQVGEGIK